MKRTTKYKIIITAIKFIQQLFISYIFFITYIKYKSINFEEEEEKKNKKQAKLFNDVTLI